MFSIPFLQELYRYMEWADAKVWSAIAHTDKATDNQDLHNRLYHTHATQRLFLQLWNGETVERYNPSRFSTLTEMYEWVKSYHAEVNTFLLSLKSDELEKPLVVPWAIMFERQMGKKPEQTTLVETMFQVANHTTYHRGQINTRLRELGGEPPLVDYIGWIWSGKPEPVWEGF